MLLPQPAGHRAPSFVLLRLMPLLAVLALLPASAQAYSIRVAKSGSTTVVHWPTDQLQYFLNASGCKSAIKNGCKNMSTAQTIEQWQAAFAGWAAVPCTVLQFKQGYHCNTALKKCLYDKGVACTQDTDCPAAKSVKLVAAGYNTNNRNELAFIDNGDWSYGTFTLGVTTPVSDSTGTIFESDVAFNGLQQGWTTNADQIGDVQQHLLSVAIHENGHFFGVQHVLGNFSKSDPPTMAPFVDPFGSSATLSPDDQKVACFLHPKGGSYVCKTDSDCPYVVDRDNSDKEFYAGKLTCSSGQCTFGGAPVGGQTALGGTCSADGECKSAMCQPYGNQAFCSQMCKVASPNCPTGFSCLPYQGTSGNGACLAGSSQPKPTKNPGDPCQSSAECTSLMCLQGTCRIKCTPKNPVECNATTEQCAPIPGQGIGACVPLPKSTKKALGEDCDFPEDCQSGVCLKLDLQADVGECLAKCAGKGTCPDGQACVPQAEGYSVCLPGSDKVPAGSACTGPKDCDTNLCVADGTSQFCSKYCVPGSATSCPCGMSCEDTTSGKLCISGKKVACMGLGAPCADDSECALGGLCDAGTCKTACTLAAGDNPCGSGEACVRLQATEFKGVCRKTGATQLSGGCAGDADCQSGFCAADPSGNGMSCQSPCDTTADDCGPGRTCQGLTGNLGGCVLGAGQVSDAGGTMGDSGITGGPGTNGGVAGTTLQPATGSACNAARGRGNAAGALLFLLAAVAIRRRRAA